MSDTMTKFSFRQILRIQLVLILTAVVEPIAAQQPIDMGDPTQVIQVGGFECRIVQE